MENIVNKTNLQDSKREADYGNRKDMDKSRDISFKSLDRLADEIRGYKDQTHSSENRSSKEGLGADKLSPKEKSLLSAAIKGNINTSSKQRYVKTREDKSLSKGPDNTLSLDRLAEKIKNNI